MCPSVLPPFSFNSISLSHIHPPSLGQNLYLKCRLISLLYPRLPAVYPNTCLGLVFHLYAYTTCMSLKTYLLRPCQPSDCGQATQQRQPRISNQTELRRELNIFRTHHSQSLSLSLSLSVFLCLSVCLSVSVCLCLSLSLSLSLSLTHTHTHTHTHTNTCTHTYMHKFIHCVWPKLYISPKMQGYKICLEIT